MSDDRHPRPAFAETLGDWFVEEMSQPRSVSVVTGRQARSDGLDLVSVDDAPDTDRRPRRWWLPLANAALVIGALVAAVVVGLRPDPAPPSDTASLPDPAVVAERVRAVCEDFGAEAERLALGADGTVVSIAADELGGRLVAAREQLTRIGSDLRVDVGEQLRLLNEAIASAEALLTAAPSASRDEIDQAVLNVDLLVVAWGRAMDDLAGPGTCSPSTLRETG